MTVETVTVTCTRHRRKVTLGAASAIVHAGPDAGNCDRACGSERFTVRREQQASRGTAHAELVRLEMLERGRAAPENDSAAAAAPRED